MAEIDDEDLEVKEALANVGTAVEQLKQAFYALANAASEAIDALVNIEALRREPTDPDSTSGVGVAEEGEDK